MMQTNTPAKATGTHDRTLLLASNVTSFKAWLITRGHEVKDAIPAHAKQGIHYWVGVPNTGKKGCTFLSVQDGSSREARHVQTHVRLRPFIDEFLTAPLASAVKAATRPKQVIQVVVDRKVQPPASKAANGSKQPTCKTRKNPAINLMSVTDLERAMCLDDTHVEPSGPWEDVITVRGGGGSRRGRTVVTSMKVFDHQGLHDSTRRVQVTKVRSIPDDVPLFATVLQTVQVWAESLVHPIILVDLSGVGSGVLAVLRTRLKCPVRLRSVAMGDRPSGASAFARFYTQRALCVVSAANACKGGALQMPVRLKLREGWEGALGAEVPFSFDANGRYTILNDEAQKAANVPCPDMFEAIAMAYCEEESRVPIEVEPSPGPVWPNLQILPLGVSPTPSANEQRANSQESTPLLLTDFLRDLRDDFAVYCPLQERQFETAEDFAIRRWEYAQAMVNARPA